jgi:hypothetical protein
MRHIYAVILSVCRSWYGCCLHKIQIKDNISFIIMSTVLLCTSKTIDRNLFNLIMNFECAIYICLNIMPENIAAIWTIKLRFYKYMIFMFMQILTCYMWSIVSAGTTPIFKKLYIGIPLIFISSSLASFHIHFHCSQVNNLIVKLSSFNVFLSLVLKSSSPIRHLK